MNIEEKVLGELGRPHGHVVDQRRIVERAMDGFKEHGMAQGLPARVIREGQEQVLWKAIDQRPDMKGYYLNMLAKIGAVQAKPMLYDLVDRLDDQLMYREVVDCEDLWNAEHALDILVHNPDVDRGRLLGALKGIAGNIREGRKYSAHVYRQCGNWEEECDIKPDDFAKYIRKLGDN